MGRRRRKTNRRTFTAKVAPAVERCLCRTWTVGDTGLPSDKQDHAVWSAGCPGSPNYVAEAAASSFRTLNPLCLTLTLHVCHKNEDDAAVDAVIPIPGGRGGRGSSKVFLSSLCRREEGCRKRDEWGSAARSTAGLDCRVEPPRSPSVSAGAFSPVKEGGGCVRHSGRLGAEQGTQCCWQGTGMALGVALVIL